MRQQKPVISVFSSHGGGAPFWMSQDDRYQIEYLSSLRQVRDIVSCETPEIEHACLVLDRSVSAKEFMNILTGLRPEFRGDVLCIDRDGSGVLSTPAMRDGRFLYRLDHDDVAFYLDARFGLSESLVFTSTVQPALRLIA